jgi:hypothetical protein
LLLSLGRLCAMAGVVGSGAQLCYASIATGPIYPAHLAAVQLHEKLGDIEVAQRHSRQRLIWRW